MPGIAISNARCRKSAARNGSTPLNTRPIGMSGARLVLTLALELRRRGGGLGAAALCGGGGQGDALIIKVPSAA